MNAVFVAKVVALSVFISAGMLVLCVMSGLFLYIALDPLMAADDLASFMLFLFPFGFIGFPLVVAASRLTLQRRRPWLAAGFFGITFVLGTLAFAGIMVGAMGI